MDARFINQKSISTRALSTSGELVMDGLVLDDLIDAPDVELNTESRLLAQRQAKLTTTDQIVYAPGGPYEGGVITFVPEMDRDPISYTVEIPVLRLHCPKVAGCIATQTFSVSNESVTEVSISFLGANFGDSLTTVFEVSSSWTTEGNCIELVHPASVVVEFGRYLYDGKPFASVAQFSMVRLDADSQPRQRRIPSESDACDRINADGTEFEQIARYQIEVGAGTSTRTINQAASTTGSIGLEIPLKADLITAGMSYSRTTSHESSLSYTLVDSRTYCAYGVRSVGGESQSAEVCWATEDVAT